MAKRASLLARPKTIKTGVWYDALRVGTLVRAIDGSVRFEYDEAWMRSPAAFPVASNLPLSQKKWEGAPVIAAFDNLLPDAEGELRARIAQRIGAAGTDVFFLLSSLGRDCVGALQFLPHEEEPVAGDMSYDMVSPEDMAADLAGLATAPLGLSENDDFRISIAGAQEKTAYLRIEDGWARPRGTTPTSHIFKTPMGVLPGPEQIDLGDSVENELFCMTLAREIGFAAASVTRITAGEQRALAIEHFDRRWDGNVLTRLPQEDFCQSLGVPSARKYQKDGGPGIRQIMEVLRESDQPSQDRENFFRAQIFFFLIGASDGHAKNFSLRLGHRGRFILAPLYDILSVAPVVHAGRLQRKRYRLAMSIDGHYGIDDIVPRHFEAEGRACGMPAGAALELLGDMAGRLEPALINTQDELQDIVPASVSEPIHQDALQRANQVLELL